MDAENHKKVKRRKNKKAVKDEGQSSDQHNIDSRLINGTVEGNMIIDHNKIDTGPVENLAEGTVTRKRKRKQKNIPRVTRFGVQTEMDARSLAEGNLNTEKSKIKDEAQNIGLAKMDIESTETSAEGNVNIESPKTQVETQSMYQTNLGNGEAQRFIEGNVPVKSKKKRKAKKKAGAVDGVQKEMDATSTENLDEGNVTIYKANVEDERQSTVQNPMNTGSPENLADGKVIMENAETQDEDMDQNRMHMLQLVGNPAKGNVTEKRRKKREGMKEKVNGEVHSERDTIRSTQNFAKENAIVKKEQKPNKKSKEKVPDEFSGGRLVARSTENLAKVNADIRIPVARVEVQSVTVKVMDTESTENSSKGSVTIEIPKLQDENQSIENQQVDTGPPQNFAEGNVTGKRKKKPKKKKANIMDKLSGRMDAGSTENLAKVMDAGYTENLAKVMNAGLTGNPTTFEIPKVQDENQSTERLTQNFAEGKRKKKRRKQKATVMDKLSFRMDAMDAGSTAVMNVVSTGNPTIGSMAFEFQKGKDENQSIENQKLDTGPPQNFAEGNVTVKRKKKPKKKKANILDKLYGRMDAGSTENLAELMDAGYTENLAKVMNAGLAGDPTIGSVTVKIPKVQDENQSVHTENFATGKRKRKPKKEKANVMDKLSGRMDAGSIKNLAELMDAGSTENPTEEMKAGSTGNSTQGSVTFEIPKVQDEDQCIENQIMETGPPQNFAEGNATVKRKKKPKKEKANILDKLSGRMDAGSTENLAELMDAGYTENLAKVMNTGLAGNPTIGSVTVKVPKVQDENQSMHTENFAKGKRKRKPKKEKAIVMDKLSGRMDAGSIKNLAELMDAGSTENPTEEMKAGSTGNSTQGSVAFEIPKVQDEDQCIENQIMESGPPQNFAEGNATVKRKKKPKKEKANVIDKLSGRMDVDSTENLAEVMDAGYTENLAKVMNAGNPTIGSVTFEISKVQDEDQSIEDQKMDAQNFALGNVTVKRKRKRKKEKAIGKEELSGSMDAETTENLTIGSATFEIPKNKEGQSMGEVKMGTGTLKNSTEEHVIPKIQKKRNRKEKSLGEFQSVSQDGTMLSLDLVSNEIILDEGIGLDEGRSATSTCNALTMKDAEVLCPRMAPFVSVSRKLLVLDINGLLGDIVFPPPKNCQADIRLCGRAVYKRPFCDDFLKFCFQNFYVGIWSSRTKRIIDAVLSYLLGDKRNKLVFCWDMTHSTQSAFKTLDNRHKPLVCKELRKIWEQDDPSLPWKKGDYNESNTLLLDDSPYKALLNPLHTSIFPHPFQYSDKNDTSLGPGGDIRVYLEGLLASDNVQKYVEQHPFGQSPINEQHPSWEFYNRVINQMSKQVKYETPHSA